MKKTTKWKKWLILPVSIILIVCFVMIGNKVLTSVIQKKIGQALRQLSPKVHIDYVSIQANLFRSSASINDLNIHFIPYKNVAQYQHSFHFKCVTLSGINFFKALFNNTLSVKDVRFNKGEVKFNQFLLDNKDSGQAIIGSLHIPFKKMEITNLEFRKTNVWLHSTSENQLLLKGNMAFHYLEINPTKKQAVTNGFHFKGVEAYLSDIKYTLPHKPYSIRVKKLVMNSKEQRCIVDSLQIIPHPKIGLHGNKTSGMGTVEATIPSIDVTKINLRQLFLELKSDKDFSKKDSATVSLTDVQVRLLQDSNGHLFHSFSCKQLISGGIDFAKAIFNETVFVNSIRLEKCDIQLNHSFLDENGLSKGNTLSQLNIPFKNFAINHFIVSGATIWLHSSGKEEHQLLKGNLTINKAILNRGNNGGGRFHFAAIICNLSDIYSKVEKHSCKSKWNKCG